MRGISAEQRRINEHVRTSHKELRSQVQGHIERTLATDGRIETMVAAHADVLQELKASTGQLAAAFNEAVTGLHSRQTKHTLALLGLVVAMQGLVIGAMKLGVLG